MNEVCTPGRGKEIGCGAGGRRAAPDRPPGSLAAHAMGLTTTRDRYARRGLRRSTGENKEGKVRRFTGTEPGRSFDLIAAATRSTRCRCRSTVRLALPQLEKLVCRRQHEDRRLG